MPHKIPILNLLGGIGLVLTASLACAAPASDASAAGMPKLGAPKQSRGEPASAVPSSADRTSRDSSRNAVGSSSAGDPDSQLLLLDAAQRLSQYRTISARLRQRIQLFDQALVGTGNYFQLLGSDNQLLSRWEMKIQMGDQVTSMQTVRDGRFVWIHENLPDDGKMPLVAGSATPRPTRSRLRRIDLRRVPTQTGAGEGGQIAVGPVVGSLAQLLYQLDRHFEFGPRKSATLYDQPVWILRGRWRATPPTNGEPVPAPVMPLPIPDRAILVLSQADLFPYRLEYWKKSSTSNGSGKTGGGTRNERPLVTMEIFEVSTNSQLDPLIFSYHPHDSEVDVDSTDLYLRQLGLPVAE